MGNIISFTQPIATSFLHCSHQKNVTFIGSLACVSYHEVLHQFQVVLLLKSLGKLPFVLWDSEGCPKIACFPMLSRFGSPKVTLRIWVVCHNSVLFREAQMLKPSENSKIFKVASYLIPRHGRVHTAVWPGYSITLPPRENNGELRWPNSDPTKRIKQM